MNLQIVEFVYIWPTWAEVCTIHWPTCAQIKWNVHDVDVHFITHSVHDYGRAPTGGKIIYYISVKYASWLPMKSILSTYKYTLKLPSLSTWLSSFAFLLACGILLARLYPPPPPPPPPPHYAHQQQRLCQVWFSLCLIFIIIVFCV